MECKLCGFHTFPNMAILLIIHNWLELDMPNVLMLDGKSYIGSHLSVSTYLRYVWVLIFAVLTFLIWLYC